ncbi:hypothetical protein PVAND_000375 [Polypedilum vanderplanki]|uniref:Nucleolar complex protein 2 homolog n=1 Tax=Polypedilum vanderplanki TaxID=319348 RepID=A0A9J6BKR2_POLVA|nr:hypothetical protein PVAND_000375 [Polypedilum vanderplanki]
MKTKSKKFEEMSIDNFFDTISSNQIEEDEEKVSEKPKIKKKHKEKKEIKSKTKKELKLKKNKKKDDEKSLKKSLKKLDKTDPELYKFLEKNDKQLLNFTMDNDEPDEEKNDESEEVHVPLGSLEVASDESDYEPEKDSDDEGESRTSHGGKRSVTLKMLREWQANLQSEDVNPETIRNVIKAFNSALLSISAEDPNLSGEFKVEGAAIFNGIIQLCVLHLESAIKCYLKISSKANFKDIRKCKRFSKLKHVLRSYLTDLTKLLENVTSNNILLVILKHLHQIATIFSAFSSITKPVLKRLIHLWATSEESVRIIAFLCVLKITRNQPEHLHQVLRTMYMQYVKNSKFVSPNSLPQINFMRRSLTELFLLDLNVAYHHAFLFIRQLAIHLRNAMILQKKEHFQQVYNWQFINSLKLWGDVLSNVSSSTSTKASDSKAKLHALIYPLVSIINGVIRLKPSAQYFPLRFHCINILINISKATNIYIPVLPYIIDVLNSNSFNQQHKKLAMKPLSFLCILRIQKGQLDENAFRDEAIEQVYGTSLQYLFNECTSIAFPDLVVPFVMSLNAFIKKTRNPKYSQKLKKLVDKIMEQYKHIDDARNKVSFSLNDMNYIKSWEINQRTGKTPLEVFYAEWQKSCKQKIKSQKVDNIDADGDEKIDDYEKLPKLKSKLSKKEGNKTEDGKVVLFPSDDEDDDDEINFDNDVDNSGEEEDDDVSLDEEEEVTNGRGEKMDTDDESSSDEGSIEDKGDIVEDLSIDKW